MVGFALLTKFALRIGTISGTDDGNVGKICPCSATPVGDGAAGSRATVVLTASSRTGKCLTMLVRH